LGIASFRNVALKSVQAKDEGERLGARGLALKLVALV
jgi:hypothetical protein